MAVTSIPQHAWAIKQNGVINVRTVGDSQRMAMVNILWVNGIQVMNHWSDAMIEEAFSSFVRHKPGTEVVRVKVEEY